MPLIYPNDPWGIVYKLTASPPEGQCPGARLIWTGRCPYECRCCDRQIHCTHRPPLREMWPKAPDAFRVPGRYVLGYPCEGLHTRWELVDHLLHLFDHFRDVNGNYELVIQTSGEGPPTLPRHEPMLNVVICMNLNVEPLEGIWGGSTPLDARLSFLQALSEAGWRVVVRVDPIVSELFGEEYQGLFEDISTFKPENVTVGCLRFAPGSTKKGPVTWEGIQPGTPPFEMDRYTEQARCSMYTSVAQWLGQRPTLCQETAYVRQILGWKYEHCAMAFAGGQDHDKEDPQR